MGFDAVLGQAGFKDFLDVGEILQVAQVGEAKEAGNQEHMLPWSRHLPHKAGQGARGPATLAHDLGLGKMGRGLVQRYLQLPHVEPEQA